MTRHVRKLSTEAEFLTCARIQAIAYPGMAGTVEAAAERFQATQAAKSDSHFWGVFEDTGKPAAAGERMVGAMRLLDFTMNYHGALLPAGGVGAIAVDLAERKRGVAKDIVTFFLDRCAAEGQYLAYLYPFRPDFYYRMGFGYGPKVNQYAFLPAALPRAAATPAGAAVAGERVEYLTPDDLPLVEEFCAGTVAHQHGMCLKTRYQLEMMLKRHETRTLVGWKKDGRLRSYLAYEFKKTSQTNFVKNDLVIAYWEWDSPEAFAVLCDFIRSLADQVHRVVFNTHQADFHFLLGDVRNGTDNLIPHVGHETNTAGVGVMYRIVDLDRLLESTAASRDYNGVTAKVALDVTDTFRPANAGRRYLDFQGGKLRHLSREPLAGDAGSGTNDATHGIPLSISINELASLLMGSVDVATLHRYGRVNTPEETLPVLEQVFRARQKPENITYF